MIPINLNQNLDCFSSIQNIIIWLLPQTLIFVSLKRQLMSLEFTKTFQLTLIQFLVYPTISSWRRYNIYLIRLFIHFYQNHGKSCWVAGWGHTQSNGVSSNLLRAIGINLFDHEYCYNHRCVNISHRRRNLRFKFN